MKTRFLILLLATLCFSTAWSADRIGNTPWHLVDYWWDFGKDTEFESYEVDFTLSNDVDPKVRAVLDAFDGRLKPDHVVNQDVLRRNR